MAGMTESGGSALSADEVRSLANLVAEKIDFPG